MTEKIERKLVSKLSIATLLGKIRVRDIPEGGELKLMVVTGKANGTKTGTSTYGDWLAFTGMFAAVNLLTGEEMMSGIVILPDIARNFLAPAVKGADGQDVEFEFLIGAKDDAASATGYVYTVKPILAPNQIDPSDALFARLASTRATLPALAAPIPNEPKVEGKKKEKTPA